jgi:HK97 family phage major capsid protein
MEQIELKAVIDEASKALKEKADNAVEKANEAFAMAEKYLEEGAKNKEELEALRKDLAEVQTNLLKEINKPKKDVDVKRAWNEVFAEQYKEKEVEIKSAMDKRSPQNSELIFDLKAAVTIGLDTTVEAAGSASQYTITENTGIISQIRKRVMTYLDNVSVGSIGTEYALWLEELDEQGTPIFIGEGDTKTQLSVRYEERTKKAKKIAVIGKMTMELMEDLPQLISYIQTNLMRRVDIVCEDQLFNGNDTGDNLAGLLGYATEFDGGDLAGSLPASSANDWDVILGIISQVKKANGLVNAIFVANGKLDAMRANKGSDGHYIWPQGISVDAQGNLSAWGVRLVGTNALPAGSDDFVGGDLSAVHVRFRSGMTIAIGESGDDFAKNLKTVRVEQRLVQFVSANDTPVLVKGTFAGAKTILETT